MANQSIFSNQWIDLVFENRNKEYGAYQLRQENPRTTLKALSIGVLLLLGLVSFPLFLNKSETKSEGIIYTVPVTPIVISSVVYPLAKPPKSHDLFPLTQKENKKLKAEVQKEILINPKITETQNATAQVAENTENTKNDLHLTEAANYGTESKALQGGAGTSTATNNTESESISEATHVSATLDKQPAFPGGINKFYSYVAQNFRIPETVLSKNVKVYVYFVIEKDGSMTDIQVLRNPGFGLDQEAIRVLKNLKTKWAPGILNGKPVRTSYNLPIVVQQNS